MEKRRRQPTPFIPTESLLKQRVHVYIGELTERLVALQKEHESIYQKSIDFFENMDPKLNNINNLTKPPTSIPLKSLKIKILTKPLPVKKCNSGTELTKSVGFKSLLKKFENTDKVSRGKVPLNKLDSTDIYQDIHKLQEQNQTLKMTIEQIKSKFEKLSETGSKNSSANTIYESSVKTLRKVESLDGDISSVANVLFTKNGSIAESFDCGYVPEASTASSRNYSADCESNDSWDEKPKEVIYLEKEDYEF